MFDWVYSLFGETSGCNTNRNPETKRPTVSKVAANNKPAPLTTKHHASSLNPTEIDKHNIIVSIEDIIGTYGEDYIASLNNALFAESPELVRITADAIIVSCVDLETKNIYKSIYKKYKKLKHSMKPAFDAIRKTDSALVDYLTSA